ncbi:hypothetical protein ZYGM_003103 [Zygosaccharomyces mellis]|uniref:Uncharacterized protein n=1 Tax=Zygosaccharomyces mellis TaxID=42258 RepID=A0A4C2E8V2_9SACH|nr:hypothetical protein ZYGM_003103 [Zygosaccharomyces mellis]
MEHDYWVSSKSAVDNVDSGYKNTFTNTKETIHLEKKNQKILRKLSHSNFPKLQLQKARTYSWEHFRLDTLPLRFTSKQYNIDYFPWPEVATNDYLQNVNYPKEKVKLENESKRLFVWLANLASFQAQCEPIAKCGNIPQGTKYFQIEYELSSYRPSRPLRPMRNEFMPSVLGTRFKETLRENISEKVTFSFDNKSWIEQQFSKTILSKDYILEVLEPPVPPKSSVKLQQWPLPGVGKNEAVFEMLKSRLFDLEFSKLEFFKMNTYHTTHTRNRSKILPVKWKISKSQRKSWDWNPFKQIEKKNMAEMTPRETITTCIFKPPIFEVEIHKLPYNSFDFINLEENTFGSVKFASASRPIPTINQDQLITSQKETTLDSTINNESHESQNTSMIPHKRSFIDDDLLTILHSRKERKKQDNCDTSGTSHEATMFHIMNQGMNKYQKIRSSPAFTALKPPKTPQIPFEPIPDKREILMNTNRMKENHKIIQYISNETHLDLIEQELPFRCDFIINATSCIFIAQLDLFFQLQADNTMYYEHIFKSLFNEFKTIVVLIKYPEVLDITDEDIFWKIRMFLQPPEFQLFLTKETPQCIGKWIDILSNKPYNKEPFDFHPFFLLHFNKFLVQKLLSSYTLEQVLLMSITEQTKELSDLLTETQLKRLQKLMALGW